ncbi:serine/threonine-protein kinase [Streptomyces sudanensis]|uniref:serine/threonine-protein kinase n=1 Tax=Streptomyces sudanensis TaxID=436397 RepID=UPI003FD85111
MLAGRYRLGAVLGRGGMGTVWRAVDETLGRTVAVKELRFPNAIDEEEKRRLITRTLREAKAIARIRNNSAVTVYDVVDEDDRPWIVMELIEGRSLADVIREDGTLTPRRAAEVGLAVLGVLRSAHRQGILHRDVKPSNVLIADDGRVVLTDFGIAQVEGDPSITSTGMLVGAPSYISPERARGQRPGPAADMWSLGGLLYACVEGHPPYDKGSAIATLTAVMTEQLDPPRNAGPLDKVIYGLLAKDPAQRLDDAGARELLDEVLLATAAPSRSGPPLEATRVVPLPPVPPDPADAAASGGARTGDATAERLRGALRSVRNAAAASTARQPGPTAAERSGRPAVRASLTDVVPRRTLVTIAVVAVLAVLATVLAFALGGDGETTAQGTGGTPGGGRTASAGTGTDGSTAPGTGDGPNGEPGRQQDGASATPRYHPVPDARHRHTSHAVRLARHERRPRAPHRVPDGHQRPVPLRHGHARRLPHDGRGGPQLRWCVQRLGRLPARAGRLHRKPGRRRRRRVDRRHGRRRREQRRLPAPRHQARPLPGLPDRRGLAVRTEPGRDTGAGAQQGLQGRRHARLRDHDLLPVRRVGRAGVHHAAEHRVRDVPAHGLTRGTYR